MDKKLLASILALAIGLAGAGGTDSARAEDCFVLNIDSLDMGRLNNNDYVAQYLSDAAPGLRVQKYISNSNELAAPVRLTLTQMDTQTLIYDKNYGYLGGTFDSGIIYLPYVGNYTVPYLVTLYIADWVYAIPFMQLEPRLEHNSACTYGVPMRDFNPSLTDDWLMGTMIDLEELRGSGSLRIPVYASNAYVVGEATVSLSGDALTVTLAFYANAQVELYTYHLYCIREVGALTTADPRSMGGRSYGIGEAIDVSGADTVLIFLPMSLSYNSAGLTSFSYDANDSNAQRQWALWNRNLLQGQGSGAVMPEEGPFGPPAPENSGGPEAWLEDPPPEEGQVWEMEEGADSPAGFGEGPGDFPEGMGDDFS